MSMIGNFKTCSGPKLQELFANPSGISSFLYPEDYDYETPDPTSLDIDKAWHAIHFLLTGDSYEGNAPLNFICMGGIPIGEEDVGYGPARGLTPVEVTELDVALKPISSTDLRDKYNAAQFVEESIYPNIWDESVEECLDDYVLDYYEELKKFISTAAQENQALIVYLN